MMPTVPGDDIWFRYVCGGVTDDLVYAVTSGVVHDAREIALEHATTLSHATMQLACTQINAAALIVAPVVRQALGCYTGDLRHKLLRASVRPVCVQRPSGATIVVNGYYYDLSSTDAQNALAFYDLAHPWRDIVEACTPQPPPDLSTQDKVYQFIGENMAEPILVARARVLREAAARLLTETPESPASPPGAAR
ncbi:MAG: hypothetical protein ACPGR8_10315 [Limisphaerales bacterium]